MATDPTFASTPNCGTAVLGAAETSLSAPTTTSTLVTAGAGGTKVEEVACQANSTTVAGLVYVFVHDGASFRLFDTFNVPANTSSATAAPWRESRKYATLVLKSGWSLRASQAVAANANLIQAHVFGGDL